MQRILQSGFTGGKSALRLHFARYVLEQLLEELRFLLLKPLIYLAPGKVRRQLAEIRRNGFVVLKGHYAASEVDSIGREVREVIRPLLSKSYPGVSMVPGSSRFRRPEKVSALFKSLSRDVYWILLHAIYNGVLRYPVLMLSFTEKVASTSGTTNGEAPTIMRNDPTRRRDEARLDPRAGEGGAQFFASWPHFDSYRHEMKVVVALTDVDENSGPTEIAAGSSSYHAAYWEDYFSSWLADHGLLKDKIETISDGFYAGLGTREKLLLRAGDVAIFDSRNIHKATPLLEGRRDLLWFYF